jgi:hypothetical protein
MNNSKKNIVYYPYFKDGIHEEKEDAYSEKSNEYILPEENDLTEEEPTNEEVFEEKKCD